MSATQITDYVEASSMTRSNTENEDRADSAMHEIDVTLKRVQTMLSEQETPLSKHRNYVDNRIRVLMTWMIIAFAAGFVVLASVLVHVAGDVARYEYLLARIEALERVAAAYHATPVPVPKEWNPR